MNDGWGGSEGNGDGAMHGDGESTREGGVVTKMMDDVPFVSTVLDEMKMKAEMYVKRRMFPTRMRGYSKFSVVMQYYCRTLSRVTGRASRQGCPVLLCIKKHCERFGWQVSGKGKQNHTSILDSKKPRICYALFDLMRVAEERFDCGSDDACAGLAAAVRSVAGSGDGGRKFEDTAAIGEEDTPDAAQEEDA